MNAKNTILVVDDDFAHRTMLKTLIAGWGYEVREADDGAAAVEAVQKDPFDLVLMDIRMVRVSGLEALEEIRRFNPALPVILMTAYASVETAVEALKKGAYDYLTKPLDFDELRLALDRALEHTHLREENRMLRESLGARFDRGNLIGRSAAMTKLLDLVAQVAPSEATALVTGESGTGKEMIAGAIHFNSPRKAGPFIRINCAAITETLLESELFGHEKGSFTGADRRKEGKFRQADRGTIFLDEVSEMSLGMQVKLLRVLQEREFTRVGGEELIRVDVRVIAATNRDLLRAVDGGPIPRGSLLPSQRGEPASACPEGTKGGHPASGPALPENLCGEEPQGAEGLHPAGHGPPASLSLAGKRPRADEHGRAGSRAEPCGYS